MRSSKDGAVTDSPGVGERNDMVDVHVAGLRPGGSVVGRVPRSAGGLAAGILDDVGAVAGEHNLTGVAGAELLAWLAGRRRDEGIRTLLD
jgi:hypothetical protein